MNRCFFWQRWSRSWKYSNFLFFWCCEFIFSDIADLILKRTNLGSFILYFYAWGYPRGIMSLTMFMSKSLHNHSSTFNIILKVAAYITQSSCVSHYTLYSQLEGSDIIHKAELKLSGYRCHFRAFQLKLDTIGSKNFEIDSVAKKLQGCEVDTILGKLNKSKRCQNKKPVHTH